MIEAGCKRRDARVGCCLRHRAFCPALGGRDVHGGDQRAFRRGQGGRGAKALGALQLGRVATGTQEQGGCAEQRDG